MRKKKNLGNKISFVIIFAKIIFEKRKEKKAKIYFENTRLAISCVARVSLLRYS